jgi:hypothetical protein
MAAFDELKKEVQKLMEQGYNFDIAFSTAVITLQQRIAEYESLANKADEMLKLKHKMIIEMKNIQR